MTTQMRLLCFAAVTLLAEAQMIPDPFIFPLKNFRPLLDQLQYETVYPEGVDLSTMSVRKMTFPAQELDCSQVNTSMPGQQCPLKGNGKIMNCNVTLSYINQDADIQGFQLNCDAAIKEATLTRVRRSGSGRGSGKGGCGGSRGSRGSRGCKGSIEFGIVQHKAKLKMTTRMRLLCFAAVTLLAEAQMIPDPFIFPLKNFRPLLDQLRVETVYPEGVDLSTMSVRKMTFPTQELDCSQVNTSMPGQQCPLKGNGKIMNCNVTLSYINQDADIQGFQLNCDAAIKEATLNITCSCNDVNFSMRFMKNITFTYQSEKERVWPWIRKGGPWVQRLQGIQWIQGLSSRGLSSRGRSSRGRSSRGRFCHRSSRGRFCHRRNAYSYTTIAKPALSQGKR
ncbi:unnamed protein product [Boreogadus saida]